MQGIIMLTGLDLLSLRTGKFMQGFQSLMLALQYRCIKVWSSTAASRVNSISFTCFVRDIDWS